MAAPLTTFFGSFFSDSYRFFDGQLNVFLNQHLQTVIDAVRGPLAAALVIYVVLYGIAIMRGVVQEPLGDAIFRMVKLAILFAAATTVAYQDWIVGPVFNGAPRAVTQAIAGKSYDQAGATFDALEEKAAETYVALRIDATERPITELNISIEEVLAALALELAAIVACIIGFAITIFALVGLALTIVMGPIFIALSLFEWGKPFFGGWLRQAFNYVVQLGVIVAMAALIASLGDTILQSNTAADPVNRAMFLIVYYLFGAFFFFQAPSVASGITGGGGLSAGEIFAGGAALAALGARQAVTVTRRLGRDRTERRARTNQGFANG